MDQKDESRGKSVSKVYDLAEEIGNLAKLVGAKFELDDKKIRRFRSFEFDREVNDYCHNL